jgi:hypothetical protein
MFSFFARTFAPELSVPVDAHNRGVQPEGAWMVFARERASPVASARSVLT